MEDRLAEFRLVEAINGPQMKIKNIQPKLMPEFSSKIKVLQQTINQIRANNKEIANIKIQAISATLNDQERRFSHQMSQFTEQNKNLCLKVKGELEILERELDSDKIENPDEPETRIKIVAYQSFSARFGELMKEFQNVQIEYKNAMKNKMSRQVKFLDPNLTDEQINSIVNDPDGAQRLFSQEHLGKTHAKVQSALSDMQDRYNDIRKLEEGVKMIHEMFLQLALLVKAQGTSIDNIDENLKQAQEYVKKASKKLNTAQKHNEQAKKWKWIIVLAIFIIGTVFILLFLP